MPTEDSQQPDRIVEEAVQRICSTRKYRSLARATIEDVVRHELQRRPGKSAVALSSAREALHRVAAFYLGEPDYELAEAELDRSRGEEAAVEAICSGILRRHLSTRERLPILRELYATIFGRTGMPRVVADLAAACNPFSFRWMGLDRSVRYLAYDINANLVRLLARYFEVDGIAGVAELRDVLCEPPEEVVDVALLLKMYHCLEHRRRGAGWEVVSRTRSRHVAVSFPSRNMRGRSADIAANYRPEIVDRAMSAGWKIDELAFDGELVILIDRGRP